MFQDSAVIKERTDLQFFLHYYVPIWDAEFWRFWEIFGWERNSTPDYEESGFERVNLTYRKQHLKDCKFLVQVRGVVGV